MPRIKEPFCPVCGSNRFGCGSLIQATPENGYWCPLLEQALAKRSRLRDKHAKEQAPRAGSASCCGLRGS
jgi:hypothetical protein